MHFISLSKNIDFPSRTRTGMCAASQVIPYLSTLIYMIYPAERSNYGFNNQNHQIIADKEYKLLQYVDDTLILLDESKLFF